MTLNLLSQHYLLLALADLFPLLSVCLLLFFGALTWSQFLASLIFYLTVFNPYISMGTLVIAPT